MTSQQQPSQLILDILDRLKSVSVDQTAFVGLDGYIDKIQRPVLHQLENNQVFYPTLDEFGLKVQSAAKKSAQIELSTQFTKLGGNGPIMANALATLGIKTNCVGTLGYPEVNPIFDQVHDNCKLYSIGPPGETNALEFNDGKLILSELSAFNELTWEELKKRIDLSLLREIINQSDFVALVDWCNLPYATQLWKGIHDECTESLKEKMIFFDLADPSKKSIEEVIKVLQLIASFSEIGNVTFGLNENEANQLYRIITGRESAADLKEVTAVIFDFLSISMVVIHTIEGSYIAERKGVFWLQNRIEPQPKVSTGGGDNYNAGLFFGLLNGFDIPSSIILASAVSGAYIKHGKSPKINDLMAYLSIWLKELKSN